MFPEDFPMGQAGLKKVEISFLKFPENNEKSPDQVHVREQAVRVQVRERWEKFEPLSKTESYSTTRVTETQIKYCPKMYPNSF